jgi:membrane protein implicated in regulation of membrane protease activity
MIDKILGAVTVGGTLANVTLNANMLQRFLESVALVVVTAIAGSILGCVLLLGGFYALYAGMVGAGLPAPAAALIVALLMFAATAALIIAMLSRLRQLHQKAPTASGFRRHLPLLGRLGTVADAFLDGMARRRAASRK